MQYYILFKSPRSLILSWISPISVNLIKWPAKSAGLLPLIPKSSGFTPDKLGSRLLVWWSSPSSSMASMSVISRGKSKSSDPPEEGAPFWSANPVDEGGVRSIKDCANCKSSSLPLVNENGRWCGSVFWVLALIDLWLSVEDIGVSKDWAKSSWFFVVVGVFAKKNGRWWISLTEFWWLVLPPSEDIGVNKDCAKSSSSFVVVGVLTKNDCGWGSLVPLDDDVSMDCWTAVFSCVVEVLAKNGSLVVVKIGLVWWSLLMETGVIGSWAALGESSEKKIKHWNLNG